MYKVRRSMNSIFLGLITVVLSLVCNDVRGETEVTLSKGQTVYVPIYSHIYSGDRERPFYLAATLSIRNADPNYPITILAVDYYDSSGKLLKRHLEAPIQLKEMASTRYVVKESDKIGGSGASFIVKWKSDNSVNPPIIESIMIGTQSQQGISFTSRGQVIREAKK
jgi:hypothetical protein